MTSNISNIKPKEATAIMNSLMAGVVPKIGVQHITVGRTREVAAVISALEDVRAGHSMMKFWIGEFGCGKSFMLHLLNVVAMKQKFVTTTADFTPEKRLYSSARKGVALYSSLMDNLAVQTKPDGGALTSLLEKWIEKVMMDTAETAGIPPDQIHDRQHAPLVKKDIMKTVNSLTDVGGFDFGMIILKYYEGYVSHNDQLCKDAVKWLKGEYVSRLEARRDLGVRSIIDDGNYYDMLKNLTSFFKYIGYSGLVINLDEAVNLYKIPNSTAREKNYEKILSIYNDCFQGRIGHMMVNLAGSDAFLENPRRGLFSYNALKTRLEGNPFETPETRDYAQPVIKLLPLTHDEVFVLLQKLKVVFDFHYKVESDIEDSDIHRFMEIVYNKPGAEEFLTPREVIKEFLHILSILRQNPGLNKNRLLSTGHLKQMGPDHKVGTVFDWDVEEF